MKRILLLVVLLVAVSMTAAFAIEVTPSFALSGSATLTWGVALDSPGATGFTNASSASFTVTLVPGTSDTHQGKAPMYGVITLSNVGLNFVDTVGKNGGGTAGAAPSVAATFNIDPLIIGVFAAPGMSSDSAAPIQAGQDTGFSNVNALLAAEPSLVLTTYAKAGTYVKYAGSNFTVQADLTSNGDWTNAPTNVNNGYAAGLEASFTFAPVTLGVGVFQGFNWGTNPLGAYFKTTVALTGIGTAVVGLDIKSDTVTGLEWELSGSAQMNFNKEATAYLLANFSYTPNTNAAANNADGAIALMIPANTLIGPVNFDMTLWYTELDTPTADLGLVAHAGYTMKLQDPMSLGLSMGAGFAMPAAPAKPSLKIIPAAVLTLTGAPVTTLTFTYTSGDLLATTPGMGTFTVALGITY